MTSSMRWSLRRATIDPATGGGKSSAHGVVPLKLSPLLRGSLPDIGAVEADQPLSTGATANNDVLTGSAAASSCTVSKIRTNLD